MKRKAPFYTGNFTGSANYDPNLPTGINKWDLQEAEDDFDDEEERAFDEDEEFENNNE